MKTFITSLIIIVVFTLSGMTQESENILKYDQESKVIQINNSDIVGEYSIEELKILDNIKSGNMIIESATNINQINTTFQQLQQRIQQQQVQIQTQQNQLVKIYNLIHDMLFGEKEQNVNESNTNQ